MAAPLALLIGCAQGKIMTYSDFQAVSLGENIAVLQVKEGRPYQINDLGNGNEEYVYIERLDIGGGRELFREYIFIVSKENRIIEKKVRESSSPSVRFRID